jgi:hypothetical protein
MEIGRAGDHPAGFTVFGSCLRLAGQLFTQLPCLNPRLRVIVLKHWEACFLQYVEPSSFLVPSFGSSAEPAPRMYWRASVAVLKRGVAVLRAAAARYDGTSSEKKDMPLHIKELCITGTNNVGLGRCRAPKMGCF